MADFEKYLLFERGLSPSQCLHVTRSYVRDITAIAVVHIKSLTVISIFAILMFTFFPKNHDSLNLHNADTTHPPSYKPIAPANLSLHILIPATKSDTNLCKLLFSASILDYPIPVIIAWDQSIEESKQEGLWGGGTHLFKISKVLEWLQNLAPEHDDDLVVMMDGYDIWFQLRKELLLERYHQVNAAANKRIHDRMGRAASIEGIDQTIIFGSGKRCFPNEIHTIACWPVPPSPLPKDMYGGNTDTTIGSFPKLWTSTRQKFLNSGFIMGPAKDMRALFTQASSKVTQLGDDPEPDDNGSRWSEKVYHSSDQSIFNMIFGEQEYQREILRLRHLSWFFTPLLKLKQSLGYDLSTTTDTLEGNPIKSILNPPWSHATPPTLEGSPREFHIGLDYWSTLSFQTANAETNGQWLHYNTPLSPQVQNTSRWECTPHLHPLPPDLTSSPPPFHNYPTLPSSPAPDSNTTSPAYASWDTIPLYTNICVGTVPAMVHLNGDKTQRESEWGNMWYQPYARTMFESLEAREQLPLVKRAGGRQKVEPGGAFADTGRVLGWGELCRDWEFD